MVRLTRRRHALAAALAAVILLGLLVSELLSVIGPRPIRGRSYLIALPVVLLVALGAYLLTSAVESGPERRRRRLLRAFVVLIFGLGLALLATDVFLFTSSAGPVPAALGLLACIPTTVFGLVVVRRLDRNEKEPWRIVLAAAAFGGIAGTTLAVGFESAWSAAAFRNLIPGPGLDLSMAFSAGLFEELAKGIAVLFLYLAMREEFDGLVDGIIYGAAVGLGFNFMESLGYITTEYAATGFAGAQSQFIDRQVLGLFFGHATFTALIGAGLGLARQTHGPMAVVYIACGFLAAIAAHFGFDALHLLGLAQTTFTTWPFTLAVLLLLIFGLRSEGRALERQLAAEASASTGAVEDGEVRSLIRPMRRFRARLRALFRGGPRAYLRAGRLQKAQLELAMQRWHEERAETDLPEAVETLRQRVLLLRPPA